MNDLTRMDFTQLAAAAAQNAVPPEEQRARAQQSKLWFQAMLAAERSGCDCKTCGLMRQQADLIAGDDAAAVTTDGNRNAAAPA